MLESEVYRRQILTSKVDPRTGKNKLFIMMAVDPLHIGIQMRSLTKTLMMISNLKKPLVSMVYIKIFQRF